MRDKTNNNVLIAYHSFSGNTKEVAEIISKEFDRSGVGYDTYVIPLHRNAKVIDLTPYDHVLIGTFTWGKGEAPDGLKRFYIDHIEELRNTNVYYFGSGDTQFGGDDLFCSALDVLNDKVPSSAPLLKVEQSPRGTQEADVIEWAASIDLNVFKHELTKNNVKESD